MLLVSSLWTNAWMAKIICKYAHTAIAEVVQTSCRVHLLLQVVDIPVPESWHGPLELCYDPEWLAIVRRSHEDLPAGHMRFSWPEDVGAVDEEEVEEVRRLLAAAGLARKQTDPDGGGFPKVKVGDWQWCDVFHSDTGEEEGGGKRRKVELLKQGTDEGAKAAEGETKVSEVLPDAFPIPRVVWRTAPPFKPPKLYEEKLQVNPSAKHYDMMPPSSPPQQMGHPHTDALLDLLELQHRITVPM